MHSNERFVIGNAYFAIPALEGARKRIVVPIGRAGNCIQVAFVDELGYGVCDVRALGDFDREVVQFKTADGVYTVSAASEVSSADAEIVCDILAHHKRAQAEMEGGGK